MVQNDRLLLARRSSKGSKGIFIRLTDLPGYLRVSAYLTRLFQISITPISSVQFLLPRHAMSNSMNSAFLAAIICLLSVASSDAFVSGGTGLTMCTSTSRSGAGEIKSDSGESSKAPSKCLARVLRQSAIHQLSNQFICGR